MARTIVARQADFSIGLRNSEGNSTGWLVDIAYSCVRHGVCREFTPVFAKHLRSFWLIDSLAIGVDRMKRNFGPMQKKGRKGGALERRELRVVVTRRGGLLPVGRPTGNYSIRGHKGVIQSRP